MADLVRITLFYGADCEHSFWLKESMLDRHSLRRKPVTLVFHAKSNPEYEHQQGTGSLWCWPVCHSSLPPRLLYSYACPARARVASDIYDTRLCYFASLVFVCPFRAHGYHLVQSLPDCPDMPLLPDLLISDSFFFSNLCLWALTHTLLSGYGFHTNWCTTRGLKFHPQGEPSLLLQFPPTCWQSL